MSTKSTKSVYAINRARHVIDAAGQPVGRLATKIVEHLIGKKKVTYTKHLDSGDYVTVENIDKIIFTGKKLEQKKYYHYSGHPGGMKIAKASELMVKNPAKILQTAVSSMLPKNTLRTPRMKRLTIK